MKIYSYIVIVVVAIAVIAGFFIVGSPNAERARKFDRNRVGDLQFIQNQIIDYWMAKGELPAALENLEKDSIKGLSIPADPETGNEYEYKIIGDLEFILCANFNQANFGRNPAKPIRNPNLPPEPAFPGASNWEHGAGRVCFERAIDPDAYKSTNPLD